MNYFFPSPSNPKKSGKSHFLWLFPFWWNCSFKKQMALSKNFTLTLLLNQSFEIRNCIMKQPFNMITHWFCLGFWVCFSPPRIPASLKVQSGKWLFQMPSLSSLSKCIFCLPGFEGRTINYSLAFSFISHLCFSNMKEGTFMTSSRSEQWAVFSS